MGLHRLRTSAKIGAVFAAVAMSLGAGLAAAKSDAEIFADYVRSPQHKTFLLRSYNELEPPPLKATCSKLEIATLDPPLVLQPAEFAQIGNNYIPSTGRWVQRATLTRCGGKAVRRLFLEADPRDGSLHALPMLPGEFAGNIQLENDATHIVLPGMMGVAKCSDFKALFVLDTKLTSAPRPEGWSETWTVLACGRTVTADVSYLADATGMNISAKNLKLH
jgi:hypothetical protein